MRTFRKARKVICENIFKFAKALIHKNLPLGNFEVQRLC